MLARGETRSLVEVVGLDICAVHNNHASLAP